MKDEHEKVRQYFSLMEGAIGLSGALCRPGPELWWSLSTGRIHWGLGCLKQHF